MDRICLIADFENFLKPTPLNTEQIGLSHALSVFGSCTVLHVYF